MAPHFLQRLELDATADERAIRRAYAQKLKKIDQEAEPAAFQELRSAYDMALRWARRPSKIEPARDAELAGANLEAAPPLEIAHSYVPRNVAVPKLRAAAPAVGAPVLGEDASALATAAYAKFMSRFEAAAADPGAIPDAKVWQASLEEVIAGEELVSMTAREIFERKFANLLAQGWKPGHEALFVSAANVFRWDEDRRHLQSFGHVGFVLERALQERASFHRQKPECRDWRCERFRSLARLWTLADDRATGASDGRSARPRWELAIFGCGGGRSCRANVGRRIDSAARPETVVPRRDSPVST